MTVTITYESSFERWRAAEKLAASSSSKTAFASRLFTTILPILSVSYLALLLWERIASGESPSQSYPIFAIAYLVFWGLVTARLPESRRERYNKLWPPGLSVHRNIFMFSDQEFTAASPGLGESRFEWLAVRKLVRNDQIALLYLSPCSSLVVPLEGLTPEERKYLDHLFTTKVKESL